MIGYYYRVSDFPGSVFILGLVEEWFTVLYNDDEACLSN